MSEHEYTHASESRPDVDHWQVVTVHGKPSIINSERPVAVFVDEADAHRAVVAANAAPPLSDNPRVVVWLDLLGADYAGAPVDDDVPIELAVYTTTPTQMSVGTAMRLVREATEQIDTASSEPPPGHPEQGHRELARITLSTTRRATSTGGRQLAAEVEVNGIPRGALAGILRDLAGAIESGEAAVIDLGPVQR